MEFWWCLKRRGPEMCTFGVLGLSCASPGGQVWWGRRGSTAHFRAPELQKHHQNSTRRPPERERRMKIVAGRGKKKSEILGGPAEGCPAEGCPAEGCPAEGGSAEGSIGNGVQGSGFGFSSGFWGRKQKQNKNKMKREMSKNKKKVKKSKNKANEKKRKRERRNRANTICSTSAN